MPLFKLDSNKFDNFINNLNNKDIIWQLIKNAIAFQAQSAKPEVGITIRNFKLERKAIKNLIRDRFNINVS